MRRCVAAAPEKRSSRKDERLRAPSGGWRIARAGRRSPRCLGSGRPRRRRDLRERGLDVRGVEVVAGIVDQDMAARGVRAARLVHVAVEPAEQRHERGAQRARSDAVGAPRSHRRRRARAGRRCPSRDGSVTISWSCAWTFVPATLL